MKLKKLFCAAALAFCAQASGASAAEEQATGLIDRIGGYAAYSGGDVVVFLSVTTPGCQRFWLSKADPGFDPIYSMLVSLDLADRPVKLYGDTSQLWPGSGAPTCKITSAWAV